MVVKVLHSEAEFDAEMAAAGSKLLILYFTAKWCGPCRQVSPIYDQLSIRYPNVVFTKVDSDELKPFSAKNNIKVLPTFLFFKNGLRVEEVKGVQANFEELIKRHSDTSSSSGTVVAGGYRDLSDSYDKQQIHCLNENRTHSIRNIIDHTGYLMSDSDEQLMINIPFNQPVKIYSIRITSQDPKKAPKTIKLYTNRASFGFTDVDSVPCQQEIVLNETNIDATSQSGAVQLKFLKFQMVTYLSIFVENNQGDEDTTRIDDIKIFGIPESSSNMQDLKKTQED